ncbi:peptidase M50 [Caldicellulosiruptor kronotskyensis 2002]|uniref:Peptidase M50 n=1 Tax=Caldicellulosiruptor kronotskyensis (strain DSM 18902 / VKM B-2412 / 2002) TaxID=632348 RepID=E4SG33_CALK2|nr:site-2 protease family protein [Caldicellulosiruptor kronotskyensis]ADQ46708.1 peptidase M50 [Caldicellulosiruptor kronotskyensis 2002]
MMIVPSIITMLLRIPGLLFAISVHESAHGFVAYLQGDDLPKRQGRITLNPLPHIDLFGAIALILFGFGWAKPVVTDPTKYKNPKIGMGLTALAGPAANILSAIVFAVVLKYADKYNIIANKYFLIMIQQAYLINVYLAIFNLLPIPPLDGSKILFIFAPNRYVEFYYRYEVVGQIILIACILFAPYLLSYVLQPIAHVIFALIEFILSLFP